uniref:Protein GPR107 n=1 Tax=Elaeis guineensis var. tenera TaxID=51953 RepID=A0A6I9R1N5_ELAGV|nr:protein GPR107 [Elaeis guineensis]
MGPLYYSLHHHLLLLLPFLLSTLPVTQSEIKNTKIVADARNLILFEQFGYVHGGHAVVSIEDVSWKPPPHRQKSDVNPTFMGFFLIRRTLFPGIMNESLYTDRFCPLMSHFVVPILTFEDLDAGWSCTRSVEVPNQDEYSLLFCNCQPDVEVTMDVRTEMYNVEGAGGDKDYLPAGTTQLPKIYFTFFLVYSVFFMVWVFICVKKRATVDKIHLVMGALLLFKGLKLVCAAEDTWYVKRTGTPHGWDVAFYVFGFFKGILLFTVIVLIGTGWSFLKPYLQEREKNVLMIVIPLQVIENIASVVIGETGPANVEWITWNQIFLLVDVVCCCAVFFPIVWSIRSLRDASKTDGKAARNLQKLTLFKQFYMVVVCYLYFTRIVVSVFGSLLGYQYQWGVMVAEEGASLAFYLFVFHNFRPVERNPYLYIGDEEEEAAAGILEMEEQFEL